jgi:phage-related tail protein
MSSINSLSTPYVPPNTRLGAYERNVKAFGPVTASALGVADAAVEAAKSTYSFSSDALQRLGDSIGEGFDAVSDGLAKGADLVSSTAGEAADGIAGLATRAADSVSEAGTYVADAVGDAIDNLEHYATIGGVAIGNALDETA